MASRQDPDPSSRCRRRCATLRTTAAHRKDDLSSVAWPHHQRLFDDAVPGEDAGALIDPVPVFDYNLGQANRQLGKYREALWHYDRFLHKGEPTGEIRDAVIAFMAEMRAHLDEKAHAMSPQDPAATSGNPSPNSLALRRDQTNFEPSMQRIDRDDSQRDWLGWSLTGSGLIAISISGILFYRASQLNHQRDLEIAMRERQSIYEQASARNLAGAIVGSGGLVLSGVGIARLVLHPRSPSMLTAINVGVSRHGIFATGRF